MARVQYIEKGFNAENRLLLDHIESVLEEFKGMPMTVRQLYYQIIARDLLPNHINSYRKVGKLVKDGRLIGEIDWDAIEDRLREPDIPSRWRSAEELIEIALDQFRLDRWKKQDGRVEVWLEKDALAGIVGEVTDEWQVTLQVNRGYSSVTAMREAAERIRRVWRTQGQYTTIGYFGDHDPSGEDMVRDVGERLRAFGATVEVEKLAIMRDDIERYNLPPQPAKPKDARTAAFRRAHGDECVELDALRPDTLQGRVSGFIKEHLDMDLYDSMRAEERLQVARIRESIG